MRRVLIPLLVLLAVTLAGCGSGSSNGTTEASSKPAATGIDGVSVGGAFGAEPTVDVTTPLTTSKTQVDTLSAGDGAKVSAGDVVTVNYDGVLGRTGDTFDSSWQRGQPTTFSTDGVIPGFAKAVVGQTVGSRVVAAVAAADGYGPSGGVPSAGIGKDDTLVFVIDIISAGASHATGTPQTPPKALPTLVLTKGVPSGFKATPDTPKTITKSTATVLISGKGAKVAKGQTITVQYLGQVYPGGTTFDSSWDKGSPFSTKIGAGGVIPCWDKLLPGQTVGSRVVLECTSDDAYGKQGSPPQIPANATLLFAVDILAAG